jgi:hypothetical protein
MTLSQSSGSTPSRVAIDIPEGSSDYEASRSLLQERIALWTMWVFILSFGFYLVNILNWLLATPRPISNMLLAEGELFHLSASFLFAAVWLVTRRVRLSWRRLRVLDGVTLVVGCGVFILMGSYLVRFQQAFGLDPSVGTYSGLLASASVVLSRAIFIPSETRRTFWLSSLAMLPQVPATYVATPDMSAAINVACWCVDAIAIATVGSHVIFGLRTEAARVRRLGQYTLEEKLGSGGMGVVYRASHAMLRRPTAIKLLPPDRAGEANLQRFEREVQMTAQLSHPNTIAIYDYGRTPEGLFYYAMEFLEGLNLDQLVRRDGAIPPGRVVYILNQICGALAEAWTAPPRHQTGQHLSDRARRRIRRRQGVGLRSRPPVRRCTRGHAAALPLRVIGDRRDAAVHGARGADLAGRGRSPQRSVCRWRRGLLVADRASRVRCGHGRRGLRASPAYRSHPAVSSA